MGTTLAFFSTLKTGTPDDRIGGGKRSNRALIGIKPDNLNTVSKTFFKVTPRIIPGAIVNNGDCQREMRGELLFKQGSNRFPNNGQRIERRNYAVYNGDFMSVHWAGLRVRLAQAATPYSLVKPGTTS